MEIVKDYPYIDYLEWAYNTQNVINEDVIRAAWWMSGLFHDMGFPLSFFLQQENSLSESYAFYNSGFYGSIGKYISKKKRSLLFSQLRGLMGNSDEITMEFLTEPSIFKGKYHGVASAINLLLWLEDIESYSSINVGRRIMFELAALAIAMHDIIYMFSGDKIPEPLRKYQGHFTKHKIEFKKDPLSFLMVLTDKLQEWGRPVSVPI